MKKLLVLLFLLTVKGVFAQNIQIKGVVKFDDGTAAEFANVVLQTKDSIFVTGTTADLKGSFSLEKIAKGNYLLVLSSIGYENNIIDLEGLSASVDLGELNLRSATIDLGNVTVTASSIANKSDRKILFPTERQLKTSTNGVALLQSMMLPRIQIDPMKNTISLVGQGNIQLRINGVEVTNSDLVALQPHDIVRVEYIESPGLRYGNADAVLNYITRRHESGGSVSMDLMQSPHLMFAQDQVSAKFNSKKSEFGLNYDFWARDFFEYWRTNEEVFSFEDNTKMHRYEKGKPGRATEQGHSASLNYNYQEPEKYYFNATMRLYAYMQPHIDFKSNLYTIERPDHVVEMSDLTDNGTYRPSLDLYYQRQLKNKQSFVLNLVGTYMRTNEKRSYSEVWNNIPVTQINTDVEGNKYSLIGEAIYEKEFETGRLSAGGKHTQALADNSYMGANPIDTRMKQAESYLYTEYQGKIKRLTYSAGVGLSRSWFKQDGQDDYETFLFRPRLSLHYGFSNRFYMRAKGELANVPPSLSELSAVTQSIDSLLTQRGNPELSPYKMYKLDFDTEYRFGKFSLVGNLTYINMSDPVMETTYRENGTFIRTYENQERMQKIWSSITLKTAPWWDILQFSLTGGLNHYISEGQTYRHNYSNWFYRGQVMAQYKNFMALFDIQSRWNNFFGETLTGGENMHRLMVTYRYKNIQAGLMVMNPFVDDYKRVNENWNQYTSNTRSNFVNESSRAFILKFAWNFNFGRKYGSVRKKVYNEDSNSGVMSVGK
ncbi:TonB-dependent receptor [Massilibacteroides vaginae]|uniref:TonB-dependent receptor n=1 Tax=Massilibacteroides vaginae TaxID=1673718 RepID=UPI000A1C9832|nr:carboxypeptidase regulatory-like domain-containing protein [Massilibacteroides vaginae]